MKRLPQIRREEILALIKELGLELRTNGPDELRGHCPEPNHKRKPGPGSWQLRIDGPKAGLHTCYACGFGGGPVALIRTCLKLSTPDAVAWFQKFVGGDLDRTIHLCSFKRKSQVETDWTELLLPENALPLFGEAVASEIQPARTYLLNRGVTEAEMHRYQFFAVPPTEKSYGGRVIVPVVVDGTLVDFVARIYVKADPTVPKALSGRRDLGAKKEKSLFGYDFLDPSIDTVHVVEGVWGALSLLRRGIPNVVASCGSSWSNDRTALLSPWEKIVLIPDGDVAGSKLVERASSLRFDHEVRVVTLEPGMQPDSVPDADLSQTLASASLARFYLSPAVSPRAWAGKT